MGTATVHKTVQTHLVPETRLVGHQVHHQVHHVPQVNVDTRTSTHTTHHVINYAPVVGAHGVVGAGVVGAYNGLGYAGHGLVGAVPPLLPINKRKSHESTTKELLSCCGNINNTMSLRASI